MMQFSVLMATYHGEDPAFLRDCLESLSVQTTPATEIVLVKDGPLTDALEAVLADFAGRLPLVTVLYEGDGHLGGALALGVTRCSCDIIARMDSDDIAHSDRFERQLAYFQQENCDLLGAAITEFDSDPDTSLGMRVLPERPSAFQIQMRCPVNHMTAMYRRHAVLEAGNYIPLTSFEDWYLWLRMHAKGARIRNMPDVLVKARTNSAFAARRSGPQYRKVEQHALTLWRREGLISRKAYVLNRTIRKALRLIPGNMLIPVYHYLLRR